MKFPKVILIASVLLGCLAIAQDISVISNLEPALLENNYHPAQGETLMRGIFRSFVYGLKGAILGFQQGLLDDERIRLSDACFGSDEVNTDLMFLADFAQGRRSVWEVVKFTTTARDLMINEIDHCNWTSTVKMLQEFCHSHDYQDADQGDHSGSMKMLLT